MKTYIALLRGINVGGHRKVPMADLRILLAKSGLEDVKTYIQSGNVVFKSTSSSKALEVQIKKEVLNHFGFDISVLVRTKEALTKIFDKCPFNKEIIPKSYFALLSEMPSTEHVDEAIKKTYENEEYYIIEDCIYFYCEAGYGKAKFNLNYFEKKLKVNATARNYKTMLKLMAMAEETEAKP